MNKIDMAKITRQITNNNNITKRKDNSINVNKKSFEEVMDKINKDRKLKFSKHAKQRLDSRNIKLDNEQINKIENAISKAENKGVKEALILMGDTAFVASIKNRIIITTATKENLKENVFTNIDGAVII